MTSGAKFNRKEDIGIDTIYNDYKVPRGTAATLADVMRYTGVSPLPFDSWQPACPDIYIVKAGDTLSAIVSRLNRSGCSVTTSLLLKNNPELTRSSPWDPRRRDERGSWLYAFEAGASVLSSVLSFGPDRIKVEIDYFDGVTYQWGENRWTDPKVLRQISLLPKYDGAQIIKAPKLLMDWDVKGFQVAMPRNEVTDDIAPETCPIVEDHCEEGVSTETILQSYLTVGGFNSRYTAEWEALLARQDCAEITEDECLE